MSLTREEPNVIGARAAARKILGRYWIRSPQDICLEDIAMARGVLVRDLPLNGAEARLVRKGSKGIIRVKEGINSPGKRRFAIAHELGHWERHSRISQMFFCVEGDLTDYSNSIPEIEANAFAGELLIPSSLCSHSCKNKEPNLSVIKELSDEFDTSLTVSAIRFIEECHSNCFIVFSEKGRIKWWRRSEEAKEHKIWIETRSSLNSSSIAWDYFNKGKASSAMEEVDSGAWFSNKLRNFTVFEQSMRLGTFPTVLSLLWLVETDDEPEEDEDNGWNR